MSAEAFEGAPRWQAVLFTAIPAFGVAAAIALMTMGGSLQPLGSPQAATPAISTPAPEEPSEPKAEEPAPVPDPEPTPEPEEPKEPVDMGEPTSELGLALVSEFGPETTFWRGGEQVRDPEKGDTFRSSYLPTAYVGELATRWVGTDDYWLLVEKNSEAEGLEVLIKR